MDSLLAHLRESQPDVTLQSLMETLSARLGVTLELSSEDIFGEQAEENDCLVRIDGVTGVDLTRWHVREQLYLNGVLVVLCQTITV